MSVKTTLLDQKAIVAVALGLLAYVSAPSSDVAARVASGAAPAPRLGAEGERLSGRATVIDGDTLAIGNERIRLEGIDAPEAGQTCGRKWVGSWRCGAAATAALRRLIGKRSVTCHALGRDKYGRLLGQCSVGDRDINAEMVRQGLAWAFVRYSARYEAVEAEARRDKVGIWQGEAQPAWAYREQRWQVAETAAPQGCAIKGNITEHGHIYHAPWSPWYAKVRIEPEKGERWFCSEAEAASAGFRPAMGE